MKRAKEITAQARKTVVQAAAEMLRARGVEGVSVADVMAAAGMTHGGFYKLFEDKEALVEEAFDLASKESTSALRGSAEQAPSGRAVQTMVDAYLSPDHRANPGRGCALAAHASDAARQGSRFRRTFTTGIYRMLDSVVEVASRDGQSIRRQEALALFSCIAGALMLARGTDDEKLASEILESARRHAAALALGDSDTPSAPPKAKRGQKKK